MQYETSKRAGGQAGNGPGALLCLVSLVSWWPAAAGSAWAEQSLRLEQSADMMGSTYTITTYGKDANQLQAAVDDAFEEGRRLDRMLSNYIPDSDLSDLNRRSAERPVKVTRELFDLISSCVQYSRESEGTFDVTVGPLMKVWGFYKHSGHLPKAEEVNKAMDHVGYRNILLDPREHTVRFAKPGVEIDPGGIGKGYAVDRMVEVLKADGVTSALVSASDSSIYALGAPPNQSGWPIRIRDPKDETKAAAEVTLKDESLSTSGSYEKFFVADGRVYSHIMDPRTGYPAQGMLSVSIIAPKTLDSEAWAKPYFVLGRAWAAKHKPKEFKVLLCEDRSEQTCAWLQ
jgi:thiamine biosynthesis lipoprotein